MAKENIAFLVNLRKNTAVGSDREGRYYPEAESKEALTTKGFAKHVSEHGGLVTYEFMQLVLAAIVKCLKEMMSQGQPVKLDGLGTFRPTVTSVKNGAASIEEALTMGVNNMVAGVNFVFIPENAQGEEITSKKFKEQCSLQFAYLVETIKKTINGKEKSYTLRTPLSAYGIVDAEAGCARRCRPMASWMQKPMPRVAAALRQAQRPRVAAATTRAVIRRIPVAGMMGLTRINSEKAINL